MDFALLLIRRVERAEIDITSSIFQRRQSETIVVLGAEMETSDP
jgi:hypothetical protein